MRNTKADIIQTARNLFARYGYDGVSTRMLASEVGISVATLNYHIGSKAQLYETVFQDIFVEDDALVSEFCNSITDATIANPAAFRDALLGFIVDHIDLLSQHPDAARLWLRRWLAEPDTQIAQLDVDFGRHLYKEIRDVLRRAQAVGTITKPFSMRYVLMSFTWMEYGFFSGGTLGTTAEAAEREQDQLALETFKMHMQLYVCNMLGLQISAELHTAALAASETVLVQQIAGA